MQSKEQTEGPSVLNSDFSPVWTQLQPQQGIYKIPVLNVERNNTICVDQFYPGIQKLPRMKNSEKRKGRLQQNALEGGGLGTNQRMHPPAATPALTAMRSGSPSWSLLNDKRANWSHDTK